MPRHFLIIERFKNRDAKPVYERVAARGRLMPDELEYVSSWVTDDLSTCYQVVRAPDRASLDPWIEAWSDLVDFEIVDVVSSDEARRRVEPDRTF